MSLFAHNSKNLQQTHADVYKDFFSRHDVVMSASFSIRRALGGIGDQNKFPSLISKIPLYQRIGVSKKDNGISFKQATYFDINAQSFLTDSCEVFFSYKPELEKILTILFKEYEIEGGCEISLLSEAGRGRGLGFTGTLCALLAAFISSQTEKKLARSDQIELAFRIEKDLRETHANGDRIIAAFEDKGSTCLYMREWTEGSKDPKRGSISLGGSDDIPFDRCILFSGTSANVEKTQKESKKDIKKREQYENDIASLTDTIHGGARNGYPDILVKNAGFFDSISDTLIIITCLCIHAIQDLMVIGEIHNREVAGVLHYLNEMKQIGEVVQGENIFLTYVNEIFDQKKTRDDQILGSIPLYSGKYGGSYLLVAPYGESRNTLEQLIITIQEKYPNVNYEYCSWRDGHTIQGVTVHQDISLGQYSEHVQKDYFKYSNNQGVTEIGSYSELFEKRKAGILLDVILDRVYINGNKLTKDDIKSQTTTVEVLGYLIDHIGEEIRNDTFAPSTFTRQENQMLGKIIGPICKLSLTYFKEALPLSCSGTLREFYLKLDKTRVVIGKIEKII